MNEDSYPVGAPELVVEVAASSASIDLRDKRRAYCRNGVREYLVWLLAEARLEWFCLEEDDYRPQLPDPRGVLPSRVFPGLRPSVAPLVADDTVKVLEALTEHNPLNRKPAETSVNSEDRPLYNQYQELTLYHQKEQRSGGCGRPMLVLTRTYLRSYLFPNTPARGRHEGCPGDRHRRVTTKRSSAAGAASCWA